MWTQKCATKNKGRVPSIFRASEVRMGKKTHDEFKALWEEKLEEMEDLKGNWRTQVPDDRAAYNYRTDIRIVGF